MNIATLFSKPKLANYPGDVFRAWKLIPINWLVSRGPNQTLLAIKLDSDQEQPYTNIENTGLWDTQMIMLIVGYVATNRKDGNTAGGRRWEPGEMATLIRQLTPNELQQIEEGSEHGQRIPQTTA